MKGILVFVMVLTVLNGCFSSETVSDQTKAQGELTTIKYSLDPFRTFEIVGTNVRAVKLEDLTSVLSKYKAEHREAEYELYAEVKCVPEESEKIVEAIHQAGIELRHYWAPVSMVDPSIRPGPHGPGHVDILNK